MKTHVGNEDETGNEATAKLLNTLQKFKDLDHHKAQLAKWGPAQLSRSSEMSECLDVKQT